MAAPHFPVPAGPRMRVLSVLSSSNQMYSGIGRAVFELTARLRERVDFEIGNLKRSHPRIRRDRLRFYAISIVPVGPRVHDEIVIRAQLGTATCSSAVRKAVAPRRSAMA